MIETREQLIDKLIEILEHNDCYSEDFKVITVAEEICDLIATLNEEQIFGDIED